MRAVMEKYAVIPALKAIVAHRSTDAEWATGTKEGRRAVRNGCPEASDGLFAAAPHGSRGTVTLIREALRRLYLHKDQAR